MVNFTDVDSCWMQACQLVLRHAISYSSPILVFYSVCNFNIEITNYKLNCCVIRYTRIVLMLISKLQYRVYKYLPTWCYAGSLYLFLRGEVLDCLGRLGIGDVYVCMWLDYHLCMRIIAGLFGHVSCVKWRTISVFGFLFPYELIMFFCTYRYKHFPLCSLLDHFSVCFSMATSILPYW